MNSPTQKLGPVSTGLPGLDRILKGLMPGDNVVWQVDSIDQYVPFVRPFIEQVRRRGQRCVYFRFTRHRPLVGEDEADVVALDPEMGFEKFLDAILDVVEHRGKGASYLFDCLSDLAADWYSDRMLGNFFLIACPVLYNLDTIAYFALLKNFHSFHATDGINNTAQVILEVFHRDADLFLHPLKVHSRSSPTLYMLHEWKGDEFRPITSSAVISEILAGETKPWLDFTYQRRGVWAQTFLKAQDALADLRAETITAADAVPIFRRLLRMAVTRDEKFLDLTAQYFDLADLIEILKRMIGTGLIGGKALGMLLARAVLRKNQPALADHLEVHDSFYIGSDVFYTYLVQNGCWWLRRRHPDFDLVLKRADEAREKLRSGVFPDYIRAQFAEMLEYFGQSPIIVRSSSLLEDNYGNAFSGKYESVYCANQGTPQERLESFMAAVREVYASTMSREALSYRKCHGLLDQDEQMALLVQRVSGNLYDGLFFPLVAGVGFSFNPYAWSENIDPKAGMIRLVAGLGTRAVDRNDDDYARIVALNLPHGRPEGDWEELRQYAQRQVDILDLPINRLVTRKFNELGKVLPLPLLDLVAIPDAGPGSDAIAPSEIPARWLLTFDKLFAETGFIQDLREMLQTLQKAYQYPVDIEFTTNFTENGDYRINLVQCRPFQVRIKREGSPVVLPENLTENHVVLKTRGPVIGPSQATTIDRLLYVVPAVYAGLTMSQRYSVARVIGRLTHLENPRAQTLMLLGPGRWGTSIPSLGVPVSFAEINTASVICEIVQMQGDNTPDVSLGTHFFNDLVEMDILYLAVFPDKDGNLLNDRFLTEAPNRLTDLLPEAAAWSQALRVIDFINPGSDRRLFLNANAMKQRAVGYVSP